MPRKITKRSMKNFNHSNWIMSLVNRNWESLGEMESVNDMAIEFSKLVNDALDDVAQFKIFTSKPSRVTGPSDNTKNIMAEKDRARQTMIKTTGEKWIALKKYKTLRNRVTHQIRQDVKASNGKRIDEATNECEYNCNFHDH